ncbi:MAG: hypothetical protein IJR41_07180 [Atopobiaceae bacterium]|nr:hypothetical protein [Atopobiaceae bacterium]
MAAPLPSAYMQSVEHLLDDLPSIFVGDKGRIPIHPLPLQQALHGLRDELVLVHGPGGIGKSDLGLNIALGALAEASVIYMSLELSSKAIMRRLLPLESALNDYDSRIDAEEFTEIELLPPVRREYVQQIVSQTRRTCCSLSIVDDAFTPGEFTGRTVEELRRAVHQRRARGEDVLVVVDYVQLLSLEEPCFTSTDHIDKVSRCLASIAHTDQVPVIAISAVGKDGSIRGSSMLQHDADIVLKMIEDEDDGEFRTVRLLFEKWREGVAGSCVTLTYAPAHHLFF